MLFKKLRLTSNQGHNVPSFCLDNTFFVLQFFLIYLPAFSKRIMYTICTVKKRKKNVSQSFHSDDKPEEDSRGRLKSCVTISESKISVWKESWNINVQGYRQNCDHYKLHLFSKICYFLLFYLMPLATCIPKDTQKEKWWGEYKLVNVKVFHVMSNEISRFLW